MTYITYLLYGIYFLCIAFTLLYALMQLVLLSIYVWKKFINPTQGDPSVFSTILPRVTIQLPLYNEQYVVERLIDNITKIDYPIDLLQIQVLDDSTDETTAILAAKIAALRSVGFPIEHVRRPNRQGYKAGALRDAMPHVTGEFIAIFDADFLPNTDFLKRTVPFFQDDSVGVVQTRWGHLNQNESLLTRLQAMQINVHFTIEQKGREFANVLHQFNGTAGVWRKATIEAAGGWENDTLIEDVDLSMRAQLAGWCILIREEIVTDAELPSTMNALKVQQFRWMKGGSENALKQMSRILKSPQLSFLSKCHSIMYLLASSMFIATVLMSLVSIPLMFFINEGQWNGFWQGLSISGAAVTVVMIAQIMVANLQKDVRKEPFFKAFVSILALLPLFFTVMSGMAFHNAIGVMEGFWGKKSSFVRTPKVGSLSLNKNKYTLQQIPKMSLFEIGLGIAFGVAAMWGFGHHVIQFQVFHALLSLGYFVVAGYCILPVIKNMTLQLAQKIVSDSLARKQRQQPILGLIYNPI